MVSGGRIGGKWGPPVGWNIKGIGFVLQFFRFGCRFHIRLSFMAKFLESQQVFEGLFVAAAVSAFVAREIGEGFVALADADECVGSAVLLEFGSSELAFAMVIHFDLQNVPFEIAA